VTTELAAEDTIESRLRRVGFALPDPGAPLAAYVPAVENNGLVQTSGQLPLQNGRLLASGRVGTSTGSIDIQTATELAKVSTVNALAAIKNLVGSLEEISQVLRVVGYVASAPDFTEQHRVVDGASTLLRDVFGPRGAHARSAIGVAGLPLGAPVEIELTVALHTR
jgi:enamine deaminase RidA (YjgF/YER057c/UK114 family)